MSRIYRRFEFRNDSFDIFIATSKGVLDLVMDYVVSSDVYKLIWIGRLGYEISIVTFGGYK